MTVKINSATFTGIKGIIVTVEVDIANGLPAFNIVGLADTSVKESKERVRAAIINSGFKFPVSRITINLAPADLRKEGTLFDLPIAVGILAATNQIENKNFEKYIIFGELSLAGELKKIKGSLPIVIEGKNSGVTKFIIPNENAKEGAIIKDIEIYPFDNLFQTVQYFQYRDMVPYVENLEEKDEEEYDVDFSEVIGQETCKRSIEVAAAGGHNILMFGPPGCGKTMIAKRIPTILPELTYEESVEVTKIYSVCGNLKEGKLLKKRPFRNPHHTASSIALVGGGIKLIPGEISLAHNGVLFLDELLEFKKSVLEVLRQPLESGKINISKATGSVEYPADFMLVGALNPCPCGYYGSGIKDCECTEYERKRYINKLSGPILDRIDIFSFVNSVPYKDIKNKNNKSESSIEIRERVKKARDIQNFRYKNEIINCNSQLTPKLINKYCNLEIESSNLIDSIYSNCNISVRSYTRILKVARTIADLNEHKSILKSDVMEAIQYRRFLDNKVI